jgi:hypothetical protein
MRPFRVILVSTEELKILGSTFEQLVIRGMRLPRVQCGSVLGSA